MYYEHKILTAISPLNEGQMNQLSLEGWELITIIEWQGAFYFYFRRLVEKLG